MRCGYLFSSPSHRGTQSQVAQPTLDPVNRQEAIPFSPHRARSMVAVQKPTSLMPWAIALDYLHGYVWVAEPGCEPTKCPTTIQGAIGQYALADGNFIQDLKEPTGFSSPLFLVVDTTGHIWFTQPNSDSIGELDPVNNIWNQWPTKKGSMPFDLVLDSHGNLWFTEYGTSAIGFFNTQTHLMVETAVPTGNSNPYGITLDTAGTTVWFAENRTGIAQIGSFAINQTGLIRIVEHAITAPRPAHLITTDKEGNVWYSEGFSGFIGEYSPASGASQTFRIFPGVCLNPATCTGTHVSGIHVDNRGDVWFTDSLSQHVGYLIPATGQVVERTLPTNVHPHDGFVLDTSNRVWFTEQYALTLTMFPMSAL